MQLTLHKALLVLASTFEPMRYFILLLVSVLTVVSCSKLDDHKESPFWEGEPNTLITIETLEQLANSNNELATVRMKFRFDEQQLPVPDNIVGFRMDIRDASFTQNIGYNELSRTDSVNYTFVFNIEKSREYCIGLRAISLTGSFSRFSETECLFVE